MLVLQELFEERKAVRDKRTAAWVSGGWEMHASGEQSRPQSQHVSGPDRSVLTAFACFYRHLAILGRNVPF